MNKLVAISVCVFSILLSAAVYAAGLGDPVKDVRTQHGAKVSVDETYYVFSKPPRVARLDVDARKFFGAMPAIAEFAKNIKVLLPSDAKLTAAYTKSSPKKQIYAFKSASLAKLPNIKDAVLDSPPGTFTIYVNYDGERVVNCAISMGFPGDADLSGTKKLSKNPFK